MPFIPHTPEALLSRNDSKNPATTCKGITANGRPCRRALAATINASPSPSPRSKTMSDGSPDRGVLAVLAIDDLDGDKAAAFFCWQHKDQAEHLLSRRHQNKTKVLRLTKRSSIDTLVDRLGVLDIDDGHRNRRKRRRRHGTEAQTIAKRKTFPKEWHDVQGPLMTVPEAVMKQNSSPTTHLIEQSSQASQRRPPRSNVKASLLCCVRAVDDEVPLRPRPQWVSSTPDQSCLPSTPTHGHRAEMSQQPGKFAVVSSTADLRRKPVQSQTANLPTDSISTRPMVPTSRMHSYTGSLLSRIPPSLSPETTSLLLAEMARPISVADEAGFIYMFWLTPTGLDSRPDDDTGSILLEPDSALAGARRGSEALQRYASTGSPSEASGSKKETCKSVLLKVGRASNVHRRLNQWNRQCGHNVTLLRYYPYDPSTSSLSMPRQVSHVHRVERLIHIELSSRRAKDMGACQSCGREHREWFEVRADRKGLREIDEMIRRWIGWAEHQN